MVFCTGRRGGAVFCTGRQGGGNFGTGRGGGTFGTGRFCRSMFNFALQQFDFFGGQIEQAINAVVQFVFGAAIGILGGAVFHMRAISLGVSP